MGVVRVGVGQRLIGPQIAVDDGDGDVERDEPSSESAALPGGDPHRAGPFHTGPATSASTSRAISEARLVDREKNLVRVLCEG